MFRYYGFQLLIILCFQLSAQESLAPEDKRSFNVKKSPNKINLDGLLDEDAWSHAEKVTDLWMKFPTNESIASLKTEIKVTYDEKNIYFGIKAHEQSKGYLLQSLKRDRGLREGDGVGIILDPINQKSNGFYFSVTPYNTQTDGLIGSGEDDLAFSWDNKWYSQTKTYDDYWTAEVAIPFSILRYDADKKLWGVNFIRSNRKSNEFHTWMNVPLQFRGFDLGYLGEMIWDQNPPRAGSNIVINPYVSTSVSADPEFGQKTKPTFNAGFDGKLAISSSLNLDLTVNPDFSQVDVDQQVTNLTRFDVFFPERRIFFLENSDLFSSFGIPPIRPFYSRRIGSKSDVNVPILFGARLSGNLAKNTRIGIMNVQTARKNDLAADNFTSAAFSQRVLARSQIKGYFHNRQASLTDIEEMNHPQDLYGRNAGFEGNYSNKEGTINGWGGLHKSWKPEIKNEDLFISGGGGYFGSSFMCFIDYDKVGKNYYTDMGFVNRVENYDAVKDIVIRRGFEFFYNETQYTFNMKETSSFNRIEIGTENFLAFDDKRKFNERMNSVNLNFDFKTTANLGISFESNTVNLLYPFRFVSDDARPPIPAQKYNYNQLGFEFRSDARKNFYYNLEFNFGKYYNADFQQFTIEMLVRKQPYISLGVNFEYNKLKFPEIYGSQEFLLIAPKIEWNFSNNLFWTSFLQYNSQDNNFNINSRLQWRYKPMSDLFLVYSDNYYTEPFGTNKNRALVLKVNYWLNL